MNNVIIKPKKQTYVIKSQSVYLSFLVIWWLGLEFKPKTTRVIAVTKEDLAFEGKNLGKL